MSKVQLQLQFDWSVENLFDWAIETPLQSRKSTWELTGEKGGILRRRLRPSFSWKSNATGFDRRMKGFFSGEEKAQAGVAMSMAARGRCSDAQDENVGAR